MTKALQTIASCLAIVALLIQQIIACGGRRDYGGGGGGIPMEALMAMMMSRRNQNQGAGGYGAGGYGGYAQPARQNDDSTMMMTAMMLALASQNSGGMMSMMNPMMGMMNPMMGGMGMMNPMMGGMMNPMMYQMTTTTPAGFFGTVRNIASGVGGNLNGIFGRDDPRRFTQQQVGRDAPRAQADSLDPIAAATMATLTDAELEKLKGDKNSGLNAADPLQSAMQDLTMLQYAMNELRKAPETPLSKKVLMEAEKLKNHLQAFIKVNSLSSVNAEDIPKLQGETISSMAAPSRQLARDSPVSVLYSAPFAAASTDLHEEKESDAAQQASRDGAEAQKAALFSTQTQLSAPPANSNVFGGSQAPVNAVAITIAKQQSKAASSQLRGSSVIFDEQVMQTSGSESSKSDTNTDALSEAAADLAALEAAMLDLSKSPDIPSNRRALSEAKIFKKQLQVYIKSMSNSTKLASSSSSSSSGVQATNASLQDSVDPQNLSAAIVADVKAKSAVDQSIQKSRRGSKLHQATGSMSTNRKQAYATENQRL